MIDARPRFFAATPTAASEWLSWAKVVAISAVVAIHTVGYNAGAEGARGDWFGRATIYVDKAAVFSVPLFVMISGALLLDPARYRGARDFLLRRGWRLVPAIVFWHVFYYLFRTRFLDQDIGVADFVVQAMNGRAYQALYYFWVILGLVIITPVLMPWIAQARRRHVAIAAAVAMAMPVLTVLTHHVRGRTDVWIETPWTWWIFYLGFYLLGWALRNVVVVRWALVASGVAILALTVLGAWAWRNDTIAPEVEALSPTNYYAFGTAVLTALVFVVTHALIARVRPFTALARGRAARVGRTLGDATLGVYAAHSAAVVVLVRLGWPTSTLEATAPWQLVARFVVVLAGVYALVLLGRRIPFVRRVL